MSSQEKQEKAIAGSLIILTTAFRHDTHANLFNGPTEFAIRNSTRLHYLRGNATLLGSYLRLTQVMNAS